MTLDNQERGSLLREAASLIARVKASFDIAEDTCAECSRRTFVNYGEHLLFDRLNRLPSKLRRTAGEIERREG